MVFSKPLLEGIRRGRIRCSIRFWIRPHVKAGGRYPVGDGQIVVDSITPIELSDVTDDLARESGFSSVPDLLAVARHGRGENIYLIRFHYVRPGGWDERPRGSAAATTSDGPAAASLTPSARTLLQRIRKSTPPAPSARRTAAGPSARGSRSRSR